MCIEPDFIVTWMLYFNFIRQTDEQEVINFLLTTEIIPLCLRIMESGSELSKTVSNACALIFTFAYYTPTTKCGGAILDSLCRVRRSIRQSVSNSCPFFNSFTNGRISFKLDLPQLGDVQSPCCPCVSSRSRSQLKVKYFLRKKMNVNCYNLLG